MQKRKMKQFLHRFFVNFTAKQQIFLDSFPLFY